MVKGVRAMGMETCMTLGMLTPDQAEMLNEAGLDYYNHNIDTSPERYDQVITTRTMDDRLDTLSNVRMAGINVCSGGIVGMGETRADRVGFVHTLATLPEHPQSVPVNALVPVKGTVLGDMLADTPLAKIDDVEFVRTVAVARITMPGSMVRLSAGRESMSEMTQAMCFLAGANSIFTGDKLLTAPNSGDDNDLAMFARLGLKPTAIELTPAQVEAQRMPKGCARPEAVASGLAVTATNEPMHPPIGATRSRFQRTPNAKRTSTASP
jgi:biotin synthase